jgi:TolB-like protein/DNA-binding winged helix-turn-helix (wHTH) protein/Flp pilus assembly protein TadD
MQGTSKNGIASYLFDDVEVDRAAVRVQKGGSPRKITPRAFEVLVYLLEHSGRIVEKQELFDQVWGERFVTDNALTRIIKEVRQVIGDDADRPRYIETVPKRGYRFIAEVTRVEAETLTNAAPAVPDTGSPANRITLRRLVYIAAISVLALSVLIVGIYLLTVNKSISPSSVRETPIDSLAILPLTNGSDDEDAEYLADGITESIINSLSQLSKLRVVARSTVFRYKDRVTEPLNVGKELGVRAVLTGRVTRRGDLLIIKAELMDVADGTQLWGDQYNRKDSNILSVQGEIAKQISENLRLKLTGDEQKLLAKRYTENAEAYQLYLKGRYFWNKRTEEGMKRGIGYFEQAKQRDPGFALAYVGLADSYNVLGFYAYLAPADSFPKAKAAAMQALEINDKLAEAHNSMAYAALYYDWNFAAAEGEFKRAINLNPNYPVAHQWYGNLLTAMGRWDEAIREFELARELDPLSLIINAVPGWTCYYARQYDRAIEHCQKAIDLDPTFALAHEWLGQAYERKGMYEKAIAEFEKAITLSGRAPEAVALLAHAYAVSGKRREAQTVLNDLIELSARHYVSPYHIATIHAGLGDRDRAFEYLENAYKHRQNVLVFLKNDPRLDSLRSDPRYADLVRRMDLDS